MRLFNALGFFCWFDIVAGDVKYGIYRPGEVATVSFI